MGLLTENFDGRRVPVKAKDRATMRGPYLYYGASGVIDSVNGYLFDGTYLLITEDGNLLSRSSDIAFVARGKFWVNNHAHVVKPAGNMQLGYL
jgi:type I restriction enzyme S subunit